MWQKRVATGITFPPLAIRREASVVHPALWDQHFKVFEFGDLQEPRWGARDDRPRSSRPEGGDRQVVVGWFRTQPATNLGVTESGACVPTPPGPPLSRGGKVMAAATAFSTGNGVGGVRPHPPLTPPPSRGGKVTAAATA